MAKAKLKKADPREVVLRLSEAEAQVLVNVLARVGGNHQTTRRGLVQNIYDVLGDVGFFHERGPCFSVSAKHELMGSIMFQEK